MQKLKFTTKRLTETTCPPDKSRVYIRDAGTDLQLMVTKAGAKTFFVRRRVNGEPIRFKIGEFPEKSVDQARRESYRQISLMNDGIDPRAERREIRECMTLKEAFDDFVENWARPRKKTWQDDRDQFERYLTEWKGRKLVAIQRHHVASFHAKVGKENGPYAANRVLALLRTVFTWLSKHRNFKGENPASGIERFAEKKRERFLQASEFAKFFEAVKNEANETIRDFVLATLFIGGRRSNVQAMRWTDVDLDGATWLIPDTKNGRSVLVPLSPEAMDIMLRRHGARGESEYVFPGRSRGHLMEPKAAWKRILARADISDLRIHDLRRTFGSFQAIGGSSLPIIGRSLGHASTAATSIYARLNMDAVRASVEKATSTMKALAEVQV